MLWSHPAFAATNPAAHHSLVLSPFQQIQKASAKTIPLSKDPVAKLVGYVKYSVLENDLEMVITLLTAARLTI